MPDRLPPRPAPRSVLVIAATIAAGLILRLSPLGLPDIVVKHGGSILWASMVYMIVSTLRPCRSPRYSAIVATIVACAVELSQLCHHPLLDTFRATRPGALLLGRVFSVADLVAYGLSILTSAIADHAIRRRLGRGHEKGRSAASCEPAPSHTV